MSTAAAAAIVSKGGIQWNLAHCALTLNGGGSVWAWCPQRRGLASQRRLEKSEVPGINTLMVANRGEIACRVMRSAKK